MNPDVFAAESAITQSMVDGTLPNGRLRVVLQDLDHGRYRMPLTTLRQKMARCSAGSVVEGLSLILSDLRARKNTPIAELQILAIGFYRLIWRMLTRLDASLSLSEIRQLSAAQAAQVCYGFTYGFQPWPFPLPDLLCARLHARIRRFLCAAEADRMWCAHHPLPLGTPLVAVRDPGLTPSANAIRNAFFAESLARMMLDDFPLRDDDDLIADVVFAADEHPERFTFLHHSDPPQVRFRVRQLALTVVALHHQAAAGNHTDNGVVSRETAIACLLSPFVSLRGWLRANHDRLSIPLVRQTTAGDPLVLDAEPLTGAPGPGGLQDQPDGWRLLPIGA
jgi:hypothetical protein